ncbi:MAG: hypothetical protein HY719_11575 [Planctomycetes bacterium]|nr:hypothetical protein [Planctomycetota bacterium]
MTRALFAPHVVVAAAPPPGPGDAGASSLGFESLPEPWVLVMVIAPLLLLWFGAAYLRENKAAPRAARFLLFLFRLAAVVALLLLLFEPVLRREGSRELRAQTVVLIDDSQSMAIRGEAYPQTAEYQPLRDMVEALRAERLARMTRRVATLGVRWPQALAEWGDLSRRRVEARAEVRALAEQITSAGPGLSDDERRALLDRRNALERRYQTRVRSLRPALPEAPAGSPDARAIADLALAMDAVAGLEDGISRLEIALELIHPEADLAFVKQRAGVEAPALLDRAERVRQNDVAVYLFSEAGLPGAGGATGRITRPVSPGDLDRVVPATGGVVTRLGDALREVVSEFEARGAAAQLSTIVVFTDGRDTGSETPPLEAATLLAARAEESAPVMVFPVGIGNPEEVRDAELLSVNASGDIILGEKVRAHFAVRSTGFPTEPRLTQAPVYVVEVTGSGASAVETPTPYLSLDGVRAPGRDAPGAPGEMSIGLLSGQRVQKHTLDFEPKTRGRHTYWLKIAQRPGLPGELTYENNLRPFTVNVTDRQVRVLYIEDRPRWEWRYLSEALRRDRNVLYQGVLLSADPGWAQPASQNGVRRDDGSVGDPPRRLLEVPWELDAAADGRPGLRNFDVVILGDVAPEQLPAGFAENLVRWVEKDHGGFVMIAGEYNAPARYKNSPLAALLPVVVPPSQEAQAAVNPALPKRYRLTSEGRVHPVTRLVPRESDNVLLWEGEHTDEQGARREYKFPLPDLYWYFPAPRVKPGAKVLVQVRDEKDTEGREYPLIVTQRYGGGIAFFSAFDETWRWRMLVEDTRLYAFWSNVLRYIGRQRLAGTEQQFEVFTDKTSYVLGETALLRATLGDPNLDFLVDRSRAGGRVGLPVIVEPDGDADRRQTVMLRMKGEETSFEAPLPLNMQGQFRAWIRNLTASADHPHEFEVRLPDAEFMNTAMDAGLLRQLPAAAAGLASTGAGTVEPVALAADRGRFLAITEVDGIAFRDRRKIVRFPEAPLPLWRQEHEGWPVKTIVLAALFGLIIVEWIGRKLARLV